MSRKPDETEAFRREAEAPRVGLVRELWDFLAHSKKWWLLPILLALAVIALLAILGGTGLAPFIYTVF
ncbi:MAG: hypothetical protein FJ288_05805 [Planctomycetes bacterium]|nr:hypothetical protein [Planctomycetota bacterium]